MIHFDGQLPVASGYSLSAKPMANIFPLDGIARQTKRHEIHDAGRPFGGDRDPKVSRSPGAPMGNIQSQQAVLVVANRIPRRRRDTRCLVRLRQGLLMPKPPKHTARTISARSLCGRIHERNLRRNDRKGWEAGLDGLRAKASLTNVVNPHVKANGKRRFAPERWRRRERDGRNQIRNALLECPIWLNYNVFRPAGARNIRHKHEIFCGRYTDAVVNSIGASAHRGGKLSSNFLGHLVLIVRCSGVRFCLLGEKYSILHSFSSREKRKRRQD